MKLIKKFVAKTIDGKSRTLHVWQKYVDVSDRGGSGTAPCGRIITTDDGDPVNVTGKGTYELPITRELLHSDDPDAPGLDG